MSEASQYWILVLLSVLRLKAITTSTNGLSPVLLTASSVGTVFTQGYVVLLQMTAVEVHMGLMSHPTRILDLTHPWKKHLRCRGNCM